MNIKPLNIKWLLEFAGSADYLVLCRLKGAKLFRIPFVPERYQTTEVFQVILTFSHTYKKGVYFLKFDTEDDLMIFSETLAYMKVAHINIHEPFPAPAQNLN